MRHLLHKVRDLFVLPVVRDDDTEAHRAESWLFTMNVVTHTDPSNLGTCFEAYSMLTTCRDAHRCARSEPRP